jgi:hypothetical protein
VKNLVLNREILLSDYFEIEFPQRKLTALARRLGMERPIGRILQETGRNSVNPAFVVGIFSGTLLLGRGDGRSIKHAERRVSFSFYLFFFFAFLVSYDLLDVSFWFYLHLSLKITRPLGKLSALIL